MKLLLIEGPNLNLLGKREREFYGDKNVLQVRKELSLYADKLGIEIDFFQSNHEGLLIDIIQKKSRDYDYFIINAGAYSHTSIAIRDALLATEISFIEVHLSNIFAREEYRQKSYLSDIALGQIVGMGIWGYKAAMMILQNKKKSDKYE